VKARTRKNPREKLALSEMKFWVDLAITYEDALAEYVQLRGREWLHPSDKWEAAMRLLKTRGRIAP